MRTARTYLIVVLLMIIASSPCFATPLEEAKGTIDDYYKYSMEKDVDAYTALFDQEYLVGIYGEDYDDLFKEVFSYVEIEDYTIDYQYYTEGQDSLTVFFNLESEMVVEGEKLDIDNDMAALFTKSEDVELRYILLQEELLGQMNREFVYKAGLSQVVEKTADIKEEAEQEGVSLEDYKSLFEEKIAAHEAKKSSDWFFWFVAVIVLLVVAYEFAIKRDVISGRIKEEKAKRSYLKVRKRVMRLVHEACSRSRKMTKALFRQMTSLAVRAYKRLSERIKR